LAELASDALDCPAVMRPLKPPFSLLFALMGLVCPLGTLCAAPRVAAHASSSDGSGVDTAGNSSSDTSDSPVTESNSDTSKVKVLYAKAKERYAAGDLEGALSYMQRCFDLSHSNNLLFNLGQLHAELSHCSVAVEYYRRFLAVAPEGKARRTAAQQVEQLGQECRENSRAPVPTSDAPVSARATTEPPPASVANNAVVSAAAASPAPPNVQLQPQPQPQPETPAVPAKPLVEPGTPSRAKVILGWTAVGTGVVTASMSAYFAVKTNHDKNQLEDELSQVTTGKKTWASSSLDEYWQRFHNDRAIAIGFGIASGITTAAGVYLLLSSQPQAKPSARAVSVSPLPGGGFASLRYDF